MAQCSLKNYGFCAIIIVKLYKWFYNNAGDFYKTYMCAFSQAPPYFTKKIYSKIYETSQIIPIKTCLLRQGLIFIIFRTPSPPNIVSKTQRDDSTFQSIIKLHITLLFFSFKQVIKKKRYKNTFQLFETLVRYYKLFIGLTFSIVSFSRRVYNIFI